MSEKNFDKIYEVVKHIPTGRVTSYGAIAKYIGLVNSARMVGWALNNSQAQKEFIPAHRVVNRNGMLTGKKSFGGENIMQELLESEGLIIENDCIINFKERFWDPLKELNF